MRTIKNEFLALPMKSRSRRTVMAALSEDLSNTALSAFLYLLTFNNVN